MKKVEPIRDRELLDRCFAIAKKHDRDRRKTDVLSWELLLVVGFNTSLRISDLVTFKVKDLRGQKYVRLEAQKTGKDTRILINPEARKEIDRILGTRDGEDWALRGRQRDKYSGQPKAISRQRAWQIMNKIARKAGIEDRIGCHTLRKTFGYHYYRLTGDVVSLQRILGHDNRRDTLVYIGIIQDEIDESLKKFSLVPTSLT